jgi:hypothetical protein
MANTSPGELLGYTMPVFEKAPLEVG